MHLITARLAGLVLCGCIPLTTPMDTPLLPEGMLSHMHFLKTLQPSTEVKNVEPNRKQPAGMFTTTRNRSGLHTKTESTLDATQLRPGAAHSKANASDGLTPRHWRCEGCLLLVEGSFVVKLTDSSGSMNL